MTAIDERITEIACGDAHSLALSENGEVYTFGDNSRGQLGFGHSSYRGNAHPQRIEELTFCKIAKIRAGLFSAALAQNKNLYMWGESICGKFYTPKLIQIPESCTIEDFEISRGGVAAMISQKKLLYTWGHNDKGQLGHGDL